MSHAITQELLELNQKLLDAIAERDWETYQLYCDPTLSAFEPEARGHLVEGMDFHQFYFGLKKAKPRINTTMADPRVRLLGENAALVTCVRLVQVEDESGFRTDSFEESRVWQRVDGEWRHVHFHRSANQ